MLFFLPGTLTFLVAVDNVLTFFGHGLKFVFLFDVTVIGHLVFLLMMQRVMRNYCKNEEEPL